MDILNKKFIIKNIYFWIVLTIILQKFPINTMSNAYAKNTDEYEYVYFGEYPQHKLSEEEITEDIINIQYDENEDGTLADEKYRRGKGEEGRYYYFKYEPVKWRVIRHDEDKIYLLSDKAIETGEFYKNETWSDSRLRKWLNEEFVQKILSKEENSHLNTVNNDLVWILNGEEWYSEEYGFLKNCKISTNKSRIMSPSDYVEYKMIPYRLNFGRTSVLLREYNQTFGIIRQDGMLNTYDNNTDDTSKYPLCLVICVDENALTDNIFTETTDENNLSDINNSKYFGYYPQKEVLGDELTDSIINARYDDNGDTVVDGIKYKRVSVSDYTDNSNNFDFFYFKWNEGGDDKGYHYFIYEPVRWDILEENENSLLLMTYNIIDTKPFDTSSREKYSYKESTLRKWLISDEFISSIFTEEEKNILTGAVTKDGLEEQVYLYQNSDVSADSPDKFYSEVSKSGITGQDKIWIPCTKDVFNTLYGFEPESDEWKEDTKRVSVPTDFAHAMGAQVNMFGQWWLRDIKEDLNAGIVEYLGGTNKTTSAMVSSPEIGLRLMVRVEKNSNCIFDSYDEAEYYHKQDNSVNYKPKDTSKGSNIIGNTINNTIKTFSKTFGNLKAVICFGTIIIIAVILLILVSKIRNRYYLALVPKNLKIFAKKKTYYFIMIVIGQIISFAILMMSYGILQNNLATKDEVGVSDTMYNIEFKEDGMSITDFKLRITELTEYMEDDFENCSIFIKYKDEIMVSILVNPDYYEIEYEGMLDYQQVIGKEYVARVSKMLPDKIGDEIEIAGSVYKIVGKYNSDMPQIPINTLNDKCIVMSSQIHLHGIPMANASERYNRKIVDLFGSNVLTHQPESIDLLEIQKNNFMIMGTIFVTVLIIINAVLCYIYILKSRKRWLAVMQICGANEKQCVIMYLLEILSINIICSFVGMCIFVFDIYGKMISINNLYKEIYSIQVYFYVTAIYLMVAGVMALYYIIKFIKSSVLRGYKSV